MAPKSFTWGGATQNVLVLFMLSWGSINSMPASMQYNGGAAFLIVSAIFFFVFGLPFVSLQVLVGQYASLGPLGIWRSFPLAFGVGIFWMILIGINMTHFTIEISKYLTYFFASFSTEEFPWMKCNQTWNTDSCQPLQFEPISSNVTTADPYDYDQMWRDDPAGQYEDSFDSFSGSIVGTLFLTWLVLAVTLAQGPKSLVRSFMVAFLAATLMNLALLIKAITLPNAGWKVRELFQPDFKNAASGGYSWEVILNMVMGKSVFFASWGSLIFVGKHVDRKKLAFPYVFFSGLAFFIAATLNAVKVGGFYGAHRNLTLHDERRSTDWVWYARYDFNHMPVLLSKIPGSNFWLLLHFAFHLCTSFSSCALILETIATSLAEIFPNESAWSRRTEFPRNLPVTCCLGLVGFIVSTIRAYVSKGHDFHQGLGLTFLLIFPIAVYFIVAAILPLMLSKVAANHSGQRRKDLMSFVLEQSRSTFCCGIVVPPLMVKILIYVGVFVGWITAWFFGVTILIAFVARVGYGFGVGVWCIVFFCILLLFILGGFIVKSVLHALNSDGHPCCVPIGPVLKKDDDHVEIVDEKVEMEPFLG